MLRAYKGEKDNELVQSFKYLLNYCNTDFYYQYHRYNVQGTALKENAIYQ